jgi:hypothetical protein
MQKKSTTTEALKFHATDRKVAVILKKIFNWKSLSWAQAWEFKCHSGNGSEVCARKHKNGFPVTREKV